MAGVWHSWQHLPHGMRHTKHMLQLTGTAGIGPINACFVGLPWVRSTPGTASTTTTASLAKTSSQYSVSVQPHDKAHAVAPVELTNLTLTSLAAANLISTTTIVVAQGFSCMCRMR